MADQPLIDISPENWRIVRDILQQHVPDREVWAFGSRAKWTAKEYSDLDIAVIGDEPLSIGVMADLNEEFQESALPFKVDVVDWAGVAPSFRKVIEKGKVLLQKSVRVVAPITLTNGVVKAEWAWSTLGNEAVNASRTFSFANRTGVVFVNTGDVLLGKFLHCNRSAPSSLPGQAKKAIKPNDILLSEIRPGNGRFAYVDFDATDYVVSTKFMVIESKGRLLPRFLYHVLTSQTSLDEFQHIAESRSGTFPQITFDSISYFPIPVPPLDQQKQLVQFLDAVESKIELLRDTNTTLEAIAQALFKSWFVDFDPVRAKAEGREPEGMPPEIAELFPSEFEDSDNGEIPKGWAVEPFGKLLGHAIGGDWGKDDADDEHTTAVAIVRGTDIPDIKVGNLDGVPRRFVSPKKLKSRRLQDGDLIIEVSGGSKTQATGRSLYCTDGLLDDFGTPVVPASFCRLFRPADKHLGILLAIHLSSIYAAGKMWNYQVQSTGLANFQTTHFLESELVVVPSEPIREAFFDCVRPLIERQQTANIRTTASLRDALLPRLMSGQLNPVENDD